MHKAIRVSQVLAALERHEVHVDDAGQIRAEDRGYGDDILTVIPLAIRSAYPHRPLIDSLPDVSSIRFSVEQEKLLKQIVMTAGSLDEGQPFALVAIEPTEVKELVRGSERTTHLTVKIRGFNNLARPEEMHRAIMTWGSELVHKILVGVGRIGAVAPAGAGELIGDKSESVGRGYLLPLTLSIVSEIPCA